VRKYKLYLLLSFLILFAACIPSPRYSAQSSQTSGYVPPPTEKSFADQQREAREQFSKTGKHEMTGGASWYGPGFHGRTTANGEKFNQNAMTAAHKTLPFNTKVRVTDLDTRKSVVVRINDRGPYAKGRIIDLSKGAAKKLGMIEKGHARVRLDIVK